MKIRSKQEETREARHENKTKTGIEKVRIGNRKRIRLQEKKSQKKGKSKSSLEKKKE